MTLFFFLFLFFSLSESFFIPNPFNNPILKSIKEFNINDYNDFLKSNINNDFILKKIENINFFIFNKVTNHLPDFHRSGDDILNMNKNIINIIYNLDIDNDLKKKLITSLIDLTLTADHAASHFLHIYKDFVQHIM